MKCTAIKKDGDQSDKRQRTSNVASAAKLDAASAAKLNAASAKLVAVIARNGYEQEWAEAVVTALYDKHGGALQDMRSHARSLVFNLNRNEKRLADISPKELVNLSSEQLAQGTSIATKQHASQLGGWNPPAPKVDLPADSPWFSQTTRKLVLVLRDAAGYHAFQKYFGDLYQVKVVHHDDICTYPGPVDAFVSPSNTLGNMDGGIDRAYANHFGWSYGYPYDFINPLQSAIEQECGGNFETGQALIVKDGDGHCLIAAPTMQVPSKIKVNSRIVYHASRAAFAAWQKASTLNTIRSPAFGTGWGQVPPEIAAAQMYEAFVDVWSPAQA